MNREELEKQIQLKTKMLKSYIKSKNDYVTSLDYIKKVLKSLNTSLQYIKTSNDNLSSAFTINGKTADAGNLKKIKEDVETAIRNINCNMIPEINKKIKTLSNNINYKENEINKLKRQLAQATE